MSKDQARQSGSLEVRCEHYFQPFSGKRIGVAVSGGGDSIALLKLLVNWQSNSTSLWVATVDHGLRPEAKAEAEFVGRICRDAKIPHKTLTWDRADRSGNLQNAARSARYRLLAEWARGHSLDVVMLAHTANDVAETFLLNLARSAGIDGLSAMNAEFYQHGITFVRPLLHERREALRRYLVGRGADWMEDPSNDDPTFDRVKMRMLLRDVSQAGLGVDAISASAFALRDSRVVVQTGTRELADRVVSEISGDVLITRSEFDEAPFELRRRLLARVLQYVSSAHYPPRHAATEKILRNTDYRFVMTLGGCLVTSDQQFIRITREFSAVADLIGEIDAPWDTRWNVLGPLSQGGKVRALGETGINLCPKWRETGLPRASLIASPSVWIGETLVAAPVAGFGTGWEAQIVANFSSFLDAH